MRLKAISLITIIYLSLFFFIGGCAGDPNQIFGFQIVDDYDDPTVEIISPINDSYYDGVDHIPIVYIAEDVSGISRLVLYVNGEQEYSTANHIDGGFNWDYDDFEGSIELQLRVVDGCGKEGWSNTVSIYIE